MDAETTLNEVADQIAAEGMIVRASRVRDGAAEIRRQRLEIEQLRADVAELEAEVERLDVWEPPKDY